jgi:hypothetical protein
MQLQTRIRADFHVCTCLQIMLLHQTSRHALLGTCLLTHPANGFVLLLPAVIQTCRSSHKLLYIDTEGFESTGQTCVLTFPANFCCRPNLLHVTKLHCSCCT